MTAWKQVRLSELIELHSGGTPSKQQPKYWDGGLPWVSPKDVKVDRLHYTEDTVTEDAIGNGTRAADSGTLLLVVRSMILAREVPLTVVQRRMCFNQDIKAITPKPGVRNDFLIAWFFASRGAILGIVDEAGHGTKRIQTDRLLALPVALPSEAEQERIASIIGAYDDLIEVNRRRIAALEEMARQLFEEWFVRFRFPGHEGHAIIETPEGSLPEGWKTLKIDDAFKIVGGGTPSKATLRYWNEGTINWYTPTDLTRSKTAFMDASSLQITEEGLRSSSAQLFPPFSVMMTSRATLGVIAVNTTAASTNQGFITCIPNDCVPLTFLTQWLRTNVPMFVAHASGATFKEITKGVFRKLPIKVPPSELVSMFEQVARPILDMTLTLERSQRRLAASRDLLLPRLISGDLSVSVERELEAVA